MEMAQIYLRESTFADCEYFAVWETQPAVTQFFTIDADRDYEEVVTEFVHRQDDTDKLQLTVCLRENVKKGCLKRGAIFLSTTASTKVEHCGYAGTQVNRLPNHTQRTCALAGGIPVKTQVRFN